MTRYPEARQVPGLVLLRWDAPLFFANAELFHDRVMEVVAKAPGHVRKVVITAEPVTSVDVSAADVLADLATGLNAIGVELCFAELKDPVRDKLRRFEMMEKIGEGNFYRTIDEAVEAYLHDSNSTRTDPG